jgi:hypothetical protein
MGFVGFESLNGHDPSSTIDFDVVCDLGDGTSDMHIECTASKVRTHGGSPGASLDRADTSPETDSCSDAQAVREIVAAYTDYEAFHVDRRAGRGGIADIDDAWQMTGGAHTIAGVLAAIGISTDAWTRFMRCGIASACAWELGGLPDTIDDRTCGGATELHHRAIFMFRTWATLPSVRASLRSDGLVVDDARFGSGSTGSTPRDGDDGPPENATRDGGGSGTVNGGDGDGDGDQSAIEREAERIMRTKFSLSDEAVADAKGSPSNFFKWSAITKVAKVGNSNFKKFAATRKFKDRVSAEDAAMCTKVGAAHMLSPKVAVAVLRMCDKAE